MRLTGVALTLFACMTGTACAPSEPTADERSAADSTSAALGRYYTHVARSGATTNRAHAAAEALLTAMADPSSGAAPDSVLMWWTQLLDPVVGSVEPSDVYWDPAVLEQVPYDSLLDATRTYLLGSSARISAAQDLVRSKASTLRALPLGNNMRQAAARITVSDLQAIPSLHAELTELRAALAELRIATIRTVRQGGRLLGTFDTRSESAS
jgi:hypothetical protein